MAYKIEYLDVGRTEYDSYDWIREEVNEELKGMTIINVETLEEDIRFWYKKED
jgi:hypothetical protein